MKESNKCLIVSRISHWNSPFNWRLGKKKKISLSIVICSETYVKFNEAFNTISFQFITLDIFIHSTTVISNN